MKIQIRLIFVLGFMCSITSCRQSGHSVSNIWLSVFLFVTIVWAIIATIRLYRRPPHQTNDQPTIQVPATSDDQALLAEIESLKEQVDNLSFMHKIFADICQESVYIEKKIKNPPQNQVALTDNADVYQSCVKMVTKIRQEAYIHFVAWAKKRLNSYPNGGKALEIMEDRDLIIFILCYCQYSNREIAAILGVVPNKNNIEMRKLDARNKLFKAGVPHDKVNMILFGTEKYLENQ